MFCDHSEIKVEVSNKSYWKASKYLETKHTSKQPMGQRRNQKENYQVLWLNENKTTHENLENATKVVLAINLQHYTSSQEKNKDRKWMTSASTLRKWKKKSKLNTK